MRSCPQCRLMLEQVDFNHHLLWCCRSCGGTWLAHDDIAGVLVANRSSLAELDATYGGVASASAYEGLAVPCAQCAGRSLEIAPVSGVAGLMAPQCPSCGGVWLVATERRRIAGSSAAARPTPSGESPPVIVPSPDATPLPRIAESRADTGPSAAAATSSEQALARLMEGNRRFATGTPQSPNRSPERRTEVAAAQDPFAIVVGCADSRVSPEIIFDLGLGDIFVVRTAGQVLGGTDELTIELGVDHWDVPLIIVLGHTGCGLMKIALAGDPRDDYLEELIDAVRPSVDEASSAPGDAIDNAVRANVLSIVSNIRQLQPIIAPRIADGRIEVVGAVYDLSTGVVTLLPDQDDIKDDSASFRIPFVADISNTPPQAPPPPVAEPEHAVAPPLVVHPATGERVFCPRCLREYATVLRKCEVCGVDLCKPEDTVPCPRCSVRNGVLADRCRACGVELRSPEAIEVLFPLPDDNETDEIDEPPAPTAVPRAPALPMSNDRWCPHCRRRFALPTTFCTQCGIALVEGEYLIACSHCRSMNPISADRCRACTAGLHPVDSRTMPPVVPHSPLDLTDIHPGRITSNNSGCSTSIIAVVAFLAAAAAAHALGAATMLAR